MIYNPQEDHIHKNFYKQAIDSYGVKDVRSLYWNSSQSQTARFISLMRLGNLHEKRVLDLGCGRADLLDYLTRLKQTPSFYMGVDLMQEFIDFSQKKYPNYQFQQGNFFAIKYGEPFDYIVCNGALNFRKKNNIQFVKEFIEFFLPFAKIGMGITLLKEAKGYFSNPLIHSYKPSTVFNLLKSMGLKFRMFDDYSDNDITILIEVVEK